MTKSEHLDRINKRRDLKNQRHFRTTPLIDDTPSENGQTMEAIMASEVLAVV
jgi:hypothetical protein